MSFAGTDRFKVIRLLGSGSMGTVYLVFDRQLGGEVALKLLDLCDGMDLYRFKGEFRSLADIKHPNLITNSILYKQTHASRSPRFADTPSSILHQIYSKFP